MSREIKFKNWNSKLKFMTEPYTLVEANIYLQASEENPLGVVPLQFTGLKDKNGKDIYEDDIVGLEVGKDKSGKMIYEYDVIFWDNDSSGFRLKSNLFLFRPECLEVIGNIYENPNLIK